MTSEPYIESAPESPVDWTDDDQPRSRLYGDVYFSTQDGLAEARAVFLQGCGLPGAWSGRRSFVVGETGFGSGLNILALLDLWRAHRPPGARLHVFTIEAHPLTAQEAARALAAWPEVADLAGLLTARWPGRARGFHRIDFPELGCLIDVAIMDVGEALAAWTGKADAWFLDGFAPALNPDMWRTEVMQALGARSAPGARAATFTVAGQVRRDLAAAGFAVEKKPGFGRKRERLEAVFPGTPTDSGPAGDIAIIGAGIAGASAARAVRALGGRPLVIEAEAPGAGASGNPAALVTPRLDAGLAAPAQLFARAFARAVELFQWVPGAILSRGAVQAPAGERDIERFAKIAGSDLFEPGELSLAGALTLERALVVAPEPLLIDWLGETRQAKVARLEHDGAGWRLLDAAGGLIVEARAVILAAGANCGDLWPDLPLSPVRGQASWTREVSTGAPATAWGGYAVPLPDGVLFGATHDRGEVSCEVRAADHDRNRATLAQAMPELAARLADVELEGRASIRAATPDFMPLAGPVPGAPAGLYLLTGMNSRGFTLAPLLAEHVAAQILDAPSPLPRALQNEVAPDRFARRAARREGRAGAAA